jgi:lambda family phage minor tail protein L
MARDLDNSLITAKNKLNDTDTWIALFEVSVSDTEVFRLTNNETAITWNSQQFSPFPIDFESFEETSSGDLPYLNVAVGNVDQMLTGYLENQNGLLDREVVIRIVHTGNLSSNIAAIESKLIIRATSVNDSTVTFKLSHHPFFEVNFPHQRYMRHRCRHQFKSAECGWDQTKSSTTSTTCDKTLDGPNGCVFHGNLYDAGETKVHPDRFGGFPGVPRRRV